MKPASKKVKPLRKTAIIDWARRHRQRTGEWPTVRSGPVEGCPGETWGTINAALIIGKRGLPGGSSLEEFLSYYRHNPFPHLKMGKVRLDDDRILGWARQHFEREGRWPHQHAGLIPGTGGLTWMAVDQALRKGGHGLSGGSSLTRLLRKRRGSARNVHSVPLTREQILEWADDHHRRTGRWPTRRSGVIPDSNGTTWQCVMTALHRGYRGFKGGVTLEQFLAKHRDAPLQRKRSSPLSIDAILEWADAHHARTGEWPMRKSGPIPGTDGETWDSVYNALYQGSRELPRTSLARLLSERRGVRNSSALPPLSEKQILVWAREHLRRTGSLPKRTSGEIPGTQGETWDTVYSALREGRRGLAGDKSLYELTESIKGPDA